MSLWLLYRMISTMLDEIEESIAKSSLLEDFRMTELPSLEAKFVELLELLVRIFDKKTTIGIGTQVRSLLTFSFKCCKVEGNEDHHGKVVKVLQDIFEIITNEMIDSSRFDALGFYVTFKDHELRYFADVLQRYFLFKSHRRILELLCPSQQMESNEPYFARPIKPQLFESDPRGSSIHFPLRDSAPLNEQVIGIIPIAGLIHNWIVLVVTISRI